MDEGWTKNHLPRPPNGWNSGTKCEFSIFICLLSFKNCLTFSFCLFFLSFSRRLLKLSSSFFFSSERKKCKEKQIHHILCQLYQLGLHFIVHYQWQWNDEKESGKLISSNWIWKYWMTLHRNSNWIRIWLKLNWIKFQFNLKEK